MANESIEELEFWGTLDDYVAELIKKRNAGIKAYCDFNGVILSSEDITYEKAYLLIYGMTREEYQNNSYILGEPFENYINNKNGYFDDIKLIDHELAFTDLAYTIQQIFIVGKYITNKNHKYVESFDENSDLITKMLETFMQPQISSRAIQAYKIVCDETNNTDSDIENNHMNVWLYVKPTKPAKFIEQKIIVTPYGIDLASIEI